MKVITASQPTRKISFVGSKLQDFSPSSISGPSSRTGAGDLAKPVVEVEYEHLSNRKKKQRLFGKVSVF